MGGRGSECRSRCEAGASSAQHQTGGKGRRAAAQAMAAGFRCPAWSPLLFVLPLQRRRRKNPPKQTPPQLQLVKMNLPASVESTETRCSRRCKLYRKVRALALEGVKR